MQGLLVVTGAVTFSGTKFEELVDLSRSVFLQPVILSGAVFLKESYFVQGRFLREVVAEKTCRSARTPRFHRSVFKGPVTFQQSRFSGMAEFLEVRFEKDANLSGASFKLGTGFSGSRFQGQANFSEASFDSQAFFTFTLVRQGTRTFAEPRSDRRQIFPTPSSRDERTSPMLPLKWVRSLPAPTDRRPHRRPQAARTSSYNMPRSS